MSAYEEQSNHKAHIAPTGWFYVRSKEVLDRGKLPIINKEDGKPAQLEQLIRATPAIPPTFYDVRVARDVGKHIWSI